MRYFDEHTCMLNSYHLLTGKKTYEQMLEKEETPAFIFNPTRPVVSMQDDVYDVLIEYFEENEDYEKCSELQQSKVINSYYSLSAPLVAYKKGMPAFRSDGNRLGKNTSNL